MTRHWRLLSAHLNRWRRKKMAHIQKNKSCRGHQIGVFIGIEFVAQAVTSEFNMS